jgi:hypothetical protein
VSTTLTDVPRKRRAAEAFIGLGFGLILIDDRRKPFANCGQCPPGQHAIKDCPHPPAFCHGWQAGSTNLGHVLGLLDRRPDANLGIVNGMSNLVTVDIDVNKERRPKPEAYKDIDGVNEGADVFALILERYSAPWPADCLHVSTKSDGAHLTWRVPAGTWIKNSSDGSFGWLVDIRGSNGYIPAPGTPVKGGCYRRVTDVMDPGPAPEWLLHHLKVTGHFPEPPRPHKPREPRPDRGRDWGYQQLDKFADELAGAPEHTGHDALCRLTTAAAHLVAEGLVSEIDARDAMFDAGASRPRNSVSQRGYDQEFHAAWRSALAKAGGSR